MRTSRSEVNIQSNTTLSVSRTSSGVGSSPAISVLMASSLAELGVEGLLGQRVPAGSGADQRAPRPPPDVRGPPDNLRRGGTYEPAQLLAGLLVSGLRLLRDSPQLGQALPRLVREFKRSWGVSWLRLSVRLWHVSTLLCACGIRRLSSGPGQGSLLPQIAPGPGRQVLRDARAPLSSRQLPILGAFARTRLREPQSRRGHPRRRIRGLSGHLRGGCGCSSYLHALCAPKPSLRSVTKSGKVRKCNTTPKFHLGGKSCQSINPTLTLDPCACARRRRAHEGTGVRCRIYTNRSCLDLHLLPASVLKLLLFPSLHLNPERHP